MSVVTTVIVMLAILGVIGIAIPIVLIYNSGSRMSANKVMLWISMVFAMTITFGVLADFSQLTETVRSEVIKYSAMLVMTFGAFMGIEQTIMSLRSGEADVKVNVLNGLFKLSGKGNNNDEKSDSSGDSNAHDDNTVGSDGESR